MTALDEDPPFFSHEEHSIEEFRSLIDSDFWPYIAPQVQEHILIFLGEYRREVRHVH